MAERLLMDRYHLYPEVWFHLGGYRAFQFQGRIYILIPMKDVHGNGLPKKQEIATFLTAQGVNGIAHVQPTNDGDLTVRSEEEEFCLLVMPSLKGNGETKGAQLPNLKVANELAFFHQGGKLYVQNHEQPFDLPWKSYWIRRLEQMENWYLHLREQSNPSEMDQLVLLTYPYVMGVSENAIQCIQDCLLDHGKESINQGMTTTHWRFHEQTWFIVQQHWMFYKLTTDFSVDHFTRDLSEWIRDHWEKNAWEKDKWNVVQSFLSDYQQIQPLAMLDWKLLLARLMFPVSFFQCVETYYESKDEGKRELMKKRLLHWITTSKERENRIGELLQMGEQFVNFPLSFPYWVKTSLNQTSLFR
ncbi:spore coat putative kinase YutH [Texcoconibacillus texcoconensis]|nr:spore coat protein YutH [Texcoconibacillus texcoconensis]